MLFTPLFLLFFFSFCVPCFVLLSAFLCGMDRNKKNRNKSVKRKRNTVYVLNRALLNMKNTNEHGIIAMYSELFTQLNESDSAAQYSLLIHSHSYIRWMSSLKQTNKLYSRYIPQLYALVKTKLEKKWRITHFFYFISIGK